MTELDHLPEFKGASHSRAELDALMSYAFNESDLEESRSLFATKWWDYRLLHPGHSLFLFAHYYRQSLERWRSKFGVSTEFRSESVTHPIWRRRRTNFELLPPQVRTAWLRAQMFADSYGIPYDKWNEYAFSYAFESKWERVPRPSNLYTIQVVTYILERWESEKGELLHLPASSFYKGENYVGDPLQDEFDRWLFNIIEKRPNPVVALRQMFIDGYLDRDRAAKRFPPEVIFSALSY